MRKIKAMLRQLWHSFYLPTLLAIVCFIIVVIVLFNSRLFKSFYLSLENDVYAMMRSQTVYKSENLSSLLNEFANLSVKIITDGQLTHTAYSRSHSSARNALSNYDLSFYKYDNLILYYPGEKYLLTVDGTCKAEVAFPQVTNPTNMLQSLEGLTLPSVFSTAGFGAEMQHSALVFVYPNNQSSFVLFVLRYETIRNMLNLDAQNNSCHIITDSNGEFLFSDRTLNSEALQTLTTPSATNNSIQTVHLNNTAYLLMCNHLPYGIRMFTLNQIIDQFDELNRITNLNIACCVAVVFLGITVLLVGIMRSYMPIAKLAQSAKGLVSQSDCTLPDRDIDALRQVFLQYGQLSQKYDRNLQMFSSEQMKNMFVLRILNGRYSSNEESDNICKHLGISFPFPYYCACVLLFDDKGTNVENKFSDVMFDEFTGYFCQTDNRRSALGIINCAHADRLMEIGETIRQHLSAGSPSMPTVAIGHAYDALQYIPVSYIEARTAMDYRLMYGLHTVILYDQTELHPVETAAYPRRELDAFALGLLNWDVTEIQTQLTELVRIIREGGLSIQQVKCICMELSTSFLREVHNINRTLPFEVDRFDIFHICEYDSIDELVQHISELSSSIRQYLESSETLCQDSDIHKCLSLINEHFESCQFSLESLYDHFSISPQTLRRRFKNATGKTMSDYLTSLRLNKAKHLLTTTSLDLTDICLQCGYTEQTSFIRAFKSKEGATPGKYREAARGNR